MLLPQAGQQLQEEERVPLHALGHGQQAIVRDGAEYIRHHLGDRGLVQVPENGLAGSVADQFGDRAAQIAAPLDGPEGQHPAHRHRSQPGRQGTYRRPGTAVRPLQVIKADQDRLARSRLLQQRLDVLQQPVPLLAGGMRILQRRPVQQGLGSAEQRVHQHG